MPLVFVPTPLGNLRDVTLRAIDVLREARLVVAEDTRVAKRLLRALALDLPELWSYREQNAARVTPGILERARTQLVAVTCDAGMPGISDPGSALVAAAREAEVAVEVLPGPSAAFAVALLSGFSLTRFAFEGFPPRAAGARRERYAGALRAASTSLWYESPQRIVASLRDLAAVAPGARVFLVREYTKLHEQQLCGTPERVAAQLAQPVRGEIAFAVAAPPAAPIEAEALDADAAIDELLDAGCGAAEIAKQLAARGAGARRALYAATSARKAARAQPRKER